eukprot:scaffold293410_cov35-Prasinocladus_malaysianus.AAC.1
MLCDYETPVQTYAAIHAGLFSNAARIPPASAASTANSIVPYQASGVEIAHNHALAVCHQMGRRE